MALAEEPYSARQREIIAAARTLLRTEGLEALTVGRIAKALGIKPPSLYKHFTGKREIEAALIAEGLEAQAEALEAAAGDLARLAARVPRVGARQPAAVPADDRARRSRASCSRKGSRRAPPRRC